MKDAVRLAGGTLLLLLAGWYCWSFRRAETTATSLPATSSATAVNAPVALELKRQGEQTQLRGVVPDAAAQAQLLARTQQLWGAAAVAVPDLKTGGSAEAGWLDWVLGVLPVAQQLGPAGELAFSAEAVTVRGVVPDQAARSRVLQQVTAVLPAAVKLNDLLTLADRPLNAAELQTQSQLNQILVKGIEFASGKAGISTSSADTLNETAAVLRAAPTVQIEIGGHTDNQGDAGANVGLSQARANAVKKFLIMQGVAPEQLAVKGYGAAQPLADNATEAGRQRNRRIEFRLRGSAPTQ